ncbi:MAG: hypothetical protein ACR2MX_01270 [Cyclobacteriaceae bacterium]
MVIAYLLILPWSTACSEEPPIEMVDCDMVDLSVKLTGIKYTDCGLPNGQITVAALGGASPYSFRLLNGELQSSPTFDELPADLYTIEVVDANGCTDSVKTLVSSKEGFSARVSVTPSGCQDNLGTVTVEPIDGVPPYKYQLGENSDYELNNTWENLTSRDYSVWVSDANDCFIGVYMFVPSGLSFAESVAPIITDNCASAACHGGTQTPDFREFSNIRQNAGKIKMFIQDTSSSKNEMLTGEEISLISCWIDDGSPDN